MEDSTSVLGALPSLPYSNVAEPLRDDLRFRSIIFSRISTHSSRLCVDLQNVDLVANRDVELFSKGKRINLHKMAAWVDVVIR